MPVVFAAYETDVILHSWSGEENDERMRENLTLFRSPPPLFNPTTQSKPSYYTYTDSNLPIMQCIMAHLICGNGGSSDEGRDGGLCNHAVGGDAVRRGVEPEKGERWKRRQGGRGEGWQREEGTEEERT